MAPTPKERVIAQIEHRETDRTPYTFAYEEAVGERLDAHYGSADWRALLHNSIERVPAPNLVVDTKVRGIQTDVYGNAWRTDRRPFHLESAALKEPSLDGYVFPDLDAVFTPEIEREARRAVLEGPESFWVAGFGFGLYERIWTLRGFTEAMIDAAADPGFYEELAEQVTVHQLEILDRLVELPVDGIMFSDDWGYQQGVLLGPDRWRRFLKPRLARMYTRVHEAGKYTLSHCCGSVIDILPDIIEIGLDVLESVQPEARGMDPYDLKRRFGSDIAFWGGLGSQSTIPFGTPQEIRHEVGRLCSEMGRGGGYLLAPSKGLQPETATENAAAVIESFLAQEGVQWP